jgi:two-component system sensor histidine kinase UhpB
MIDTTRSDEALFRSTFENAAVGMAHVSRDGSILRVNQKLCDILGYSNDELRGKHFRELTHPDDLESDLRLMAELINGRIESYSIEKRFFRKNGSIVWGRLTASMQDPEIGVGVLEDITERKRIEEELEGFQNEMETRVEQRASEFKAESEQRRYLAKRLVDLLEEDRRDLSMMLHEEVGQRIAGSKMALENFQGDLTRWDAVMSKRLDPVLQSLQEVIGSLRDLSRRLHPSTLDVLGLEPALRSLGDGIQTEKCDIELFFRGVPQSLNHDLKIAIFRIAQEAVTNAIRHAACERISLSFIRREDKLFLTIEDDGRGFDVEKEIARAFGLVIMRERAVNVGGELRVESSPGKGTTVMAEFPIEKQARESSK